MSAWRNQRRYGWIGLFAVVVCVICFLAGTAFDKHTLSGDAFEKLRRDVQNELDARHKAAQMTNELFPGATVAFVLRDGRVAGFATGFSDIEEKSAMLTESRMPAGSIGKTYVAAVALNMVSDGTLDLDGKIVKWLSDEPWFNRLPNREMITLRHLLNHSSGLIDHVFDTDSGFQDYFRGKLSPGNTDHTIDPRELVQFALDREPLFPAGEGFHYSDTGYILVGLIIEKASGSTYYKELSNRFLKPMNLTLTSPLNQRKIVGLAQGYAPKSQQLFGLPYKVVDAGTFVFDPSLEWTGGGVVSNSKDLVRWVKALYEGRAISRPYLDEMLNSIANPEKDPDDSGRAYGYGLGVSIAKTKYGTTYRHGGFFPGYNSMLAYFPDHRIAVAMQINSDTSKIEEHFEVIVKIIMEATDSGFHGKEQVNEH